MKDLYTTQVKVTGGRNGSAASDDGKLTIDMALPKALGGTGEGTNPEQLFAAGFAGCFTSSLQAAAQTKSVALGDLTVDATVVLGAKDDGSYGLKAEMAISAPSVDRNILDSVITEARRICAYSNATKGNVETTYKMV